MSKRETILLAAAKLFADRSYDAVGIRDIAVKAKANSSMISYYFGGKAGLLREIIHRFMELYMEMLNKTIEDSKDRQSFIDNMVRRTIESARSNSSRVIRPIRPLYSAIGMNSAGETGPMVGQSQRASASKPTQRREGTSMIG